jgi:excisionase family DNA binding protein
MQGDAEVVGGPLLTVREVSERLKVSRATVHALCEGGKLAFIRASTHSMRILEGDLAAYVRSTRVRRE